MKMTIEKQLQLLEETVAYYSENTLRRCVIDRHCMYSGKLITLTESDGCAVGRLLPKELAEKFDELGGGIIAKYFDLLPKKIKGYTLNFLRTLQRLHDNPIYWNDSGSGLTKLGKNYFEIFKNEINNGKYINNLK